MHILNGQTSCDINLNKCQLQDKSDLFNYGKLVKCVFVDISLSHFFINYEFAVAIATVWFFLAIFSVKSLKVLFFFLRKRKKNALKYNSHCSNDGNSHIKMHTLKWTFCECVLSKSRSTYQFICEWQKKEIFLLWL